MEGVWILGLICMLLCSAETQTTEHYFVLGQNFELRPPHDTKDITGVQWRHNDNIVAEWRSPDTSVDTYGQFKNRAALDTTTGVLVLSKMTEADAGDYTVEINDRRLEAKYVVKLVKEVSKAEVWEKPSDEKRRELVCEGSVQGNEPVTYCWIFAENRTCVELGQTIVIHDNETMRLIETFACKIRNPVSEKESAPIKNPFFERASNSSALWALVIIPIVVLIGVGIWKKEDIKARLCPGGNTAPAPTPTTAPSATYANVPSAENGALNPPVAENAQ